MRDSRPADGIVSCAGAEVSTPGLYRKFEVCRTDGSSGPGGAHEGCAYFVLDLEHDEHAIPMLAAYAASCASSEPGLARDLHEIVEAHASSPRCACREVGCPHALAQALHEGASATADRIMAGQGILSRSVAELDLSVRATNCLSSAGIQTLGDLTSRTADQLRRIHGSDRRVVRSVVEELAQIGLALAAPDPPDRAPRARSARRRQIAREAPEPRQKGSLAMTSSASDPPPSESSPDRPLATGISSFMDEIDGPIAAQHLPRILDRLDGTLTRLLEAVPEFEGGAELAGQLGDDVACLRAACREACLQASIPWTSEWERRRTAEWFQRALSPVAKR